MMKGRCVKQLLFYFRPRCGCTLRNKLTNVLGLDCKGAAILEINERTNDKDRQYLKVGTDQLYNERIKNGIVRGRSRIICFSSCAKKKKKNTVGAFLTVSLEIRNITFLGLNYISSSASVLISK